MPTSLPKSHAASGWSAPFRRYERHISAAAMVVGFAIDNYAFGRVDHPGPHIVFIFYLALGAASIALAHVLQERADRKLARHAAEARSTTAATDGNKTRSVGAGGAFDHAGSNGAGSDAPRPPRWRTWLAAATQFALGGLWSGFLVFYSRSAALAASWPFLLLLLGFLIGNEAFRRYHSRLVFSALLLFFALYSYAVFVVPVFSGRIGLLPFLASGALALAAFGAFLRLLSAWGAARFRQSRWKLIGGAAAITVAMNVFYFTGVLPPLPLALSDVGVYHLVTHTGATYEATAENEPWYTAFGLFPATVHVVPGQPLYLYSAVFAPIRLNTRISHRWQRLDAGSGHWILRSVVSFPISGGRSGGYRAYSIKSDPTPGKWRVDISTDDGRLIGRFAFDIVSVPVPVATTQEVLR